MEYKELKKQPAAELRKTLGEYREKIREMRFKVAQRQFKNVREIREIKRTIGKILTILKEQVK